MYLHAMPSTWNLLTCAGLHALRPFVINFSVARSSTILEPSTTGSATTYSAGFLERAALWARHSVSDGWRDDCRGDWHVNY